MDHAALLARYRPEPTGVVLDHDRQLFQARFSPCGKFLLAGGYDATIQRWDLRGADPVRMKPGLGHSAWVPSLVFIPGCERVAAADSWGMLSVRSYVEDDPAPIWSNAAAHDGWIRALAAGPDGTLLATGGNDRNVRVWNAADGTLRKEWPHPDQVFALAFAPDGATLFSGGLTGIVREWDPATGVLRREIDTKVLYRRDKIQECGGVRSIVFDAEGKRFACAGQKNPGGGFSTGVPCIVVYDRASGEPLREMAVGGNDDGFAYDAAFHPAGFVMGTSCAFPGKGHVWFWRPEDDKPFHQANTIPNGRSLSPHPDGRRLALCVSLAPNANGRQLVDGKYPGGSSKIHILTFPEVAA
jgi:WD40 repeat protein